MAVGMHQANWVIPVLNTLKGTAFTPAVAGATWVQLHTADPGAAGGTAISGGDNVRKQLAFTTAVSNTISMTTAIGPWTNVATTESITHISLWTLVTAGLVYITMALTTQQPWVATNTFMLNTCSYTLTPVMA
jgi:thiosulfate reductase cytochrome b subunit